MIKILAIETVNKQCSVAMGNNNLLLDYEIETQNNQQSKKLINMIQDIIARNELTYDDFQYIAVNVGPGSFTGVRVGISLAKGLKLALPKIALIAINSLEAVYHFHGEYDDKIAIALNAGRNQLYFQVFNDETTHYPKLINVKALEDKEYDIVGTMQEENLNYQPNAQMVLKAAQYKINNELLSNEKLEPFYLREPDAKLPTKKLIEKIY